LSELEGLAVSTSGHDNLEITNELIMEKTV
jgi:hypothetical protein